MAIQGFRGEDDLPRVMKRINISAGENHWIFLAHLYVSSSPIEVEMQILNLAVICKLILELFLGGFFMDVCDEHDPPFDSCPFRGGEVIVVK